MSDEEYGFSPMERMRQERDAAIAERDQLRAQLEEREADMHARIRASYDATIADCWRAALAKAEAERDRLRRELEAWREDLRATLGNGTVWYSIRVKREIDRLNAILRGES